MHAVSFERVSVRYRLPARAPGAKRRLDSVFRTALDGLHAVLVDRGLHPEALVCVRRLRTRQTVRLADPDLRLIDTWTDEMADDIIDVIAAGGPDVIRYRSRRHALADVVLTAAMGGATRAWAWAQLGLWSRGNTTDASIVRAEALRVLASDPPAIVPVLVAVAAAGTLGALVEHGRDGHWSELARAALRAVGDPWDGRATAPAEGARARMTGRASAATPPLSEPWNLWETAIAGHLASSKIARALRALAPRLTAEKRHACAVLCLLEVGPTLPRLPDLLPTPSSAADPLAAPRDARDRTSASPESGRRAGPTSADWIAAADAALFGAAAEETHAADEVATTNDREPARAAKAELRRDSLARSRAPREDIPTTDPNPLDDPRENAPAAERARPAAIAPAVTERAGLLFFLHLVRDLDLPARVAADPRLASRAPRQVLAHVAAALVPDLSPQDPAALAFLGLGPDADPPRDQPPWMPEEQAAAAEHAIALIAALTRRLTFEADDDRRLLTWLVHRRASVVTDPGWIEIQFALSDVSVDLRRAGLDLHPNWLPWLGVVVRFTYV